eukprot:symbB.v1.2.001455.t1/scaffold58.1/size370606/24
MCQISFDVTDGVGSRPKPSKSGVSQQHGPHRAGVQTPPGQLRTGPEICYNNAINSLTPCMDPISAHGQKVVTMWTHGVCAADPAPVVGAQRMREGGGSGIWPA